MSIQSWEQEATCPPGSFTTGTSKQLWTPRMNGFPSEPVFTKDVWPIRKLPLPTWPWRHPGQPWKWPGKKVEDIQLIIMATITPDTHCPAGANWLQAKLDAPQAVTFDVTAACSGFIFALNVAEQYIKGRDLPKRPGSRLGNYDQDFKLERSFHSHPLGRRGRGCFSFRKWRRLPKSFPPTSIPMGPMGPIY